MFQYEEETETHSYRGNRKSATLGLVKTKSEGGVVVQVSDVELAEDLLPTQKTHESIKGLINGKAESCCDYSDDVVDARHQFHPLMAAAHIAFAEHRPLVLSPDMVWLAIAQGVARHINLNAEKFRSRFVKHEGKEEIHIIRNGFVRGSPENEWAGVFSEFSNHINAYVGNDNYGLMVQEFSTTTPVEKAAFEVTLMDGMQSYFEMHCHTMCGIPEVTLKGTTSDWSKILSKLNMIATFELDWWVDSVRPVVEKLLETSQGKVDPQFWTSLYKVNDQSGGPYVSGWITRLMPYIKQRGKFSQNPNLLPEDKRGWGGGIGTENFDGGLSVAPFIWDYLGQDFNYEMIGGFVGIKQDTVTKALTPKIGWAVREKPLKK